MRRFLAMMVIFISGTACRAQETVPEISPEQSARLEDQVALKQTEIEDDSYFQTLDHFRKHPINLNDADEEDLKELHLLSALQITGLVRYRILLGKLVSI